MCNTIGNREAPRRLMTNGRQNRGGRKVILERSRHQSLSYFLASPGPPLKVPSVGPNEFQFQVFAIAPSRGGGGGRWGSLRKFSRGETFPFLRRVNGSQKIWKVEPIRELNKSRDWPKAHPTNRLPFVPYALQKLHETQRQRQKDTLFFMYSLCNVVVRIILSELWEQTRALTSLTS